MSGEQDAPPCPFVFEDGEDLALAARVEIRGWFIEDEDRALSRAIVFHCWRARARAVLPISHMKSGISGPVTAKTTADSGSSHATVARTRAGTTRLSAACGRNCAT